MRIMLLFLILSFGFGAIAGSYDDFEKASNKINTREIETGYKLPEIGSGFFIANNKVSSLLIFQCLTKNRFSLDLAFSDNMIGLNWSYILVRIVNIKIGILTGYSLDKDFSYHKWFGGLSFTIFKF